MTSDPGQRERMPDRAEQPFEQGQERWPDRISVNLSTARWWATHEVRESEGPSREYVAADRERALVEAIRNALNELGVPGPDYPAPVANAVDILRAALEAAQQGGADA